MLSNNVSFLIKKDINNKNQIDIKKTTQEEKKESKIALLGLSVVALSTLAGISYYTGQRVASKKLQKIIASPLTNVPNYISTKTSELNGLSEHVRTIDTKPKWVARTTADISKSPEWDVIRTDNISKNDIYLPKRNNSSNIKPDTTGTDEVVPGIIRQISKEIKEYMLICGINKDNNKVNPEVLDNILTKAVGSKNVREYPYVEDGKQGVGRKKIFRSPNGRLYTLETHDSPKGIVTRLYMNCPDKHLRAYLHADGTFRLNSYKSSEAHFSTTAKGVRWMNDSKYLKNKD